MDQHGEADRQLVVDLAAAVLNRTAPEEVVLLDETSQEYFENPAAVLDPAQRDESVGFGVELALLTPYVLAIVTPVINFLLNIAVDAVKGEVRPNIVAWVRRVIRKSPDEPANQAGSPAALTPEQVRTVREIAYQRARDIGVDETQANLLADAVAGGVLVAQ
jgi:hypothetical protein